LVLKRLKIDITRKLCIFSLCNSC